MKMPPRAFHETLQKSFSNCKRTRNLKLSITQFAKAQRRWNHQVPDATAPAKPYYVTSPIFYVNAAPHIGHLYSLLLADVLKRWNSLLGKRSILCTGTDEHGMKIQQAASKAGMFPKPFCDEMYKPFKDLAEAANIDCSHFVRTSDLNHHFAVQHFWHILSQRGYIYQKKHEGWYSVSDETFYPESGVGLTLDPRTGRKHMASKETGKEVEWTSEINYHFRLSAFKDRLLEHYEKNPDFIIPKTRMAAVISEVSAGLQDLSISRPRDRLSWGIPVPEDESQTIYVWLDALINYLTKANYPFSSPDRASDAGWPADCHVIGKDIVRFHCIYWPAFLMAVDLPRPNRILTHAHWTLGREKMSKSTGVAVNPFFAIDRFGVDTIRFYLVYAGGIKDDASYDNKFIINHYRTLLMGGLGNLLSRLVRGTGWNVQQSIKSMGDRQRAFVEFQELLTDLPANVSTALAFPDPISGLQQIMDVVRQTNAFMQQVAPWAIGSDDSDDQARKNECIFMCAESLRICGILLQPFMPGKAKELLDILGVAKNARSFKNATFGCDTKYGKTPPSFIEEKRNLFPPPLSWF